MSRCASRTSRRSRCRGRLRTTWPRRYSASGRGRCGSAGSGRPSSNGILLVVARSGWSKHGGFEICLRDGSCGGALWDRIWNAGKPHGLRPGAPNLIDRIESRLISYGTDVTLEHDPFEAGLDAFCDLDKPAEYLARAALAERRGRTPVRRLERVVIGGGRIEPNIAPMPLHAAGGPAGCVTSSAWSPRQEKNVALAMVATQREEGALRVTLADGDEREVAVAGEDWSVAGGLSIGV